MSSILLSSEADTLVILSTLTASSHVYVWWVVRCCSVDPTGFWIPRSFLAISSNDSMNCAAGLRSDKRRQWHFCTGWSTWGVHLPVCGPFLVISVKSRKINLRHDSLSECECCDWCLGVRGLRTSKRLDVILSCAENLKMLAWEVISTLDRGRPEFRWIRSFLELYTNWNSSYSFQVGQNMVNRTFKSSTLLRSSRNSFSCLQN
jgi:hypothetical protein